MTDEYSTIHRLSVPPPEQAAKQNNSRLRQLSLGVVLLITLGCGVVALQHGVLPRSSGDVRALFPFHSPNLSAVEHLERLFGASQFDSIIVAIPEELDDGVTEQLDALEEELATLPGVETVLNPTQAFSRLKIPARLRNELGDHGRFIVEISNTLSDRERVILSNSLDEVVTRFSTLDPVRAGPFSLSEAATRSIEEENHRFTPISIGALIILTVLLFHSLRVAIATLIPPFLALWWVFSALNLLNIPLTPISQLVPPLLLALGSTYSVYVAARITLANHRDHVDLQGGLRSSLILAAVTTIVGFASLTVINTRSVVQFGVIMSVGTAVTAWITALITPWLAHELRGHSDRFGQRLDHLGRLATYCHTRAGVIIFAVASLLFALWIPTIAVDTSPLDFLPQGSVIQSQFHRARAIFPGTHTLSVVIESNAGALSDQAIDAIATIEKKLKDLTGIIWTTSIADIRTFRNRIAALPSGSEMLPDLCAPAALTVADCSAARILIETDEEGQSLLALKNATLSIVHEVIPNPKALNLREPLVASQELVLSEQSTALAKGLLLSVVSALALVGVLLFFLFRSPTLAVLGLIPSLLPILIVFGVLGLIGKRVDLGAAMVAAVALGIVSDNTFHLLLSFRHLRTTLPAEEALHQALAASMGPFIVTATIAIGGFSMTDFSNLLPMRQFGILLGVSLFLGLLTNTLVLPTLLRSLFNKGLLEQHSLAKNQESEASNSRSTK